MLAAIAACHQGNAAGLGAKPQSLYWEKGSKATATAAATDQTAAKKLWEVSEKLTGVKFGL